MLVKRHEKKNLPGITADLQSLTSTFIAVTSELASALPAVKLIAGDPEKCLIPECSPESSVCSSITSSSCSEIDEEEEGDEADEQPLQPATPLPCATAFTGQQQEEHADTADTDATHPQTSPAVSTGRKRMDDSPSPDSLPLHNPLPPVLTPNSLGPLRHTLPPVSISDPLAQPALLSDTPASLTPQPLPQLPPLPHSLPEINAAPPFTQSVSKQPRTQPRTRMAPLSDPDPVHSLPIPTQPASALPPSQQPPHPHAAAQPLPLASIDALPRPNALPQLQQAPNLPLTQPQPQQQGHSALSPTVAPTAWTAEVQAADAPLSQPTAATAAAHVKPSQPKLLKGFKAKLSALLCMAGGGVKDDEKSGGAHVTEGRQRRNQVVPM